MTWRRLAILWTVIAFSMPSAVFLPVAGRAPEAVAQQAATTATTTDRLNLRTGPALTYPVRTVIPLGEKVNLGTQETNGFRSVSWQGQTGWAFSTWLSLDAPVPSPNETATTTDRLNLRSGPGTTFGIVTVLERGAIVTLTGQESNGFRSVTFGSFSGWVATEFLSFATSPPPPPVTPPSQLATTTDNVNLRSGPGLTFSVIRVVPVQTEVTITGPNSNGFSPVSVAGVPGWISADYLVPEGSEPQPTGTATTTDRLNLRSAPNTTSAIVVVIPTGATVSLTGQSNNGFRSVRYGNLNGWAFEAYLNLGTTTPTPTPPTPPAPTVPFDVTNTIVGPVRGSANQALAVARSMGAQRMDQVTLYITEIYRRAPEIGFDPALLVSQSALETDFWRSSWWINRLNPAGLGVTGDPAQNAASPTFTSGTISARAQLAHMHAEVYGNRQPLPPVLQGVDPTYQRVFAAGWAGTIVTVEDLAGTWAVDPLYDVKIISRARVIFPAP
jgi:uncharacterized protein YraI